MLKYLKKLIIGALLHDSGKADISRKIWHKRGPLNEKEWRIVQKHPYFGVRRIENSDLENDADVKRCILYHHEKIDGSGYPEGLRDDEIPFIAKIISVVDAFDAMTSSRPYRAEPYSISAALKILEEEKKFDSDTIKCIGNIMGKKFGEYFKKIKKL